MQRSVLFIFAFALSLPSSLFAQSFRAPNGDLQVSIINNPYTGSRSGVELSGGPQWIVDGGLLDRLRGLDCDVAPLTTVALTPEEQQDYGEWHRLGLANGHLWRHVAEARKANRFTVGLLGNCNSLMGMLAGFQHSGPSRRPLRVGLVWIDAHGDFNTPETTLSGMLGGMPVAVSAGMCLTRLRLKSGLEPAIPTRHIVMAAVRDLDPLEQDLIDRSEVQRLTTRDLRERGEALHAQMRRLSELTDVIYIHIDMDVLDPAEVPGHPLTVPDGPTSRELADALAVMFQYEKTVGLGLASTPYADPARDEVSRRAVTTLIEGALTGLRSRNRGNDRP